MGFDKSNFIHPLAHVGEAVKMGKNNYIGAFCIINNCEIGSNNRFESHCSIGAFPEHKAAKENKGALIGDNNTFREFVTLHGGVEQATEIGNNNWFLVKSHIGHDATIYSDVVVSTAAIIGGHCKIYHYANLGLGSIIHQYKKIPHGSMLGMGCIITKTTAMQPFTIYVGNPAKAFKPNLYYLKIKYLPANK